MHISLAPMEGVIDFNMRQMLTDLGGYRRCVTEFIRVTNSIVPARVFHRLCPELGAGGLTRAGTPVYLQLLGSDPGRMAASAEVAARAGARGIDINFGCPAKIVNRHNGGSALLQQPNLVGHIVSAVRQQVDPAVPVCAKIRLGYDSSDRLADIVGRVVEAGASELCIHARTRSDGYRPPAYWHHIGNLEHVGTTTLIVNGEIWDVADARDALHQSRCNALMIGRGGLARPDLGRLIQSRLGTGPRALRPLGWPEVAALVDRFYRLSDSNSDKYAGNRTKQWLGYLRRTFTEADQLFQRIKKLRSVRVIGDAITDHRRELESRGAFRRAPDSDNLMREIA